MARSIRIHGLKETQRAFREYYRKLAVQLGKDLKRVAGDPVTADAREKATRYTGASIQTIKPRRSGARVFVEQSARKVTGNRSDFGALQMRRVLVPALEENRDKVTEEVNDLLGRYARETGL